ncbi:MAG: InlB B-repeat-containing protein [Paludibacteraceae bacterium]|nr:InlB B-repeat-containing protein [Paludibacteraceae bacterium]
MKKLLLLLCSFWLLSATGLMAQVRVPFTMDSNIFYGAYVTTGGKYNYEWTDGQIRIWSGGLLEAGCGFCWDDRFFTVEITGVPDIVSFTTSASALATALGETDWKLEESANGETWQTLWTSSNHDNNVSERLNPNTKYVRLHYGLNYSGYVKNFSISARHHVTFRADGETLGVFGPFGKDESLGTIVAPTPEKACYDFVGWDRTLPAKMGGEDIVLNALFEEKEYSATIRFSNEAENIAMADSVISFKCGSSITVDGATVEGFTFGGWSPELPSVGSPEMDGQTYVAQWTRNVYKLNYIDGANTSSVSVEYGRVIPELTKPEKEGYTFLQWIPSLPETMPSHDVSVSAEWRVNKHSLTLHLTEDSVLTDSLDYGAVFLLPIPSRSGYTFDGWKDLLESMPDHDVDVWAQWIQNEYRFSAVVAGDTLLSAFHHMGDTIQLSDTFGVYGYSIVGWEPSLPAVMPDSDWTVTAILKANSHWLTVRVDSVTTYSEQVDFATPIDMDLLVPGDSAGVAFEWISEPIASMPDSDVVLLGKYVNQKYPLRIYDDELVWVDTLCPYDDSLALCEPVKRGYHLTNWDDVPSIMPASPVEVRLVWEKNTYAIALEVDNDTLWTNTVAYADTIAYPVFPDSIGYRLYWTAELPVVMPDSDVLIHGYWDEYKWLCRLVDRDTVLLSGYYRPGETIAGVTDPVREGYTFVGWSPEIPVLMPDSDFSAIAQWERNTYPFRVFLDEETIIDTVYYYDDTIVAPYIPERVGYTLVQDTCPARMPARPVKLSYAWSVNHHRLVLKDGDEVLLDLLYGYGDQLPDSTLSHTGYTFAGWQPELPATMPDTDIVSVAVWNVNHYKLVTLVDGDTLRNDSYAFEDAIVIMDVEEKTGYRFDWLDSFPVRMPAEDVTVRGHYSPLSYPFVVLVDGDTLVSKTYLFGELVEVPAAPQKEGYSFVGWKDSVPAYMPAHPLRLEAVWETNRYRLQLVDMDSVTLDTTIAFGGALPQFPELVKEGYTFMGWDDTLAVMPSWDVEVNAMWKTNRYCVTLMIVSASTMKMLELPRKVMFDYGESIVFDDFEQDVYRFVKWNNECPETMPAKNFALIALVDELGQVGVSSGKSEELSLYVQDGKIHLSGDEEGDVISLYDMLGKLVFRGTSREIEVSVPGAYLLKTKGLDLKVVVK